MDMRFYETFGYVIYGFIMLLLLLVPIIGKEVGGNKAWLGVGSFGVQPSEFAKFATALAVAKFMGSVGFRMDQLRNQIIIFAMIGDSHAFDSRCKKIPVPLWCLLFLHSYFSGKACHLL